MITRYKILHLEDVATDAELVLRELKRNHIDFEHCLIDNEVEFINALDTFSPDIILCDHSLPSFNSFEAIKIVKEKKLHIPFILITATMSEDVAMGVVRAGADDYILKDRLKRLSNTVLNNIEKYRFEKERKQLIDEARDKEALSKSQLEKLSNKLMLATRVAGIGVWDFDLALRRFTYDDVFFSLYGVNATLLDGTMEKWLDCIHKDDKERFTFHFNKALQDETEVETEFRIIKPDGSLLYIKATAAVQKDASGKASSIIGTNQDITVSKKAEKDIQESEAKYRSFFENSKDGILLVGPQDEVVAANPAVCALFHLTETEFCKPEYLQEAGLIISDILPLMSTNAGCKQESIFKRKNGSSFTSEISTSSFKDAIGNERKLIIIRDVSDRKIAEQKLVTTSNALQNALNVVTKIMDSSFDIICTITERGKFVTISSALERILGYSPDELVGKKLIDLVLPEDREKTRKAGVDVLNDQPVTIFENRVFHKNGSVVPLLWSARWDENERLIFSIAKDATEKKRQEQDFKNERQRFYELFLQAPSFIAVLRGPEHIYEVANPLYLKVIGKDDIIGKPVRLVLPELAGQGYFETLDNVYRTGRSFSFDERLVMLNKNNDGNLVETYSNFLFQPSKNANGIVDGILIFGIDITEQVEARKRIEESEKRFRRIVETAQEGIWMMDKENKTVFINTKLGELLEYSPDEMIGKTRFSFKDKEEQQRLSLKQQDKHEIYETKFLTKSGKTIWARVSTNPIFEDDGTYNGALAMVTDITERKLQDLQIKKNVEEREVLIDELTKSIKDLKQFSFITSHNFRAPLSNLIGLLSLFDYSNLSATNKEIVEMFKVATNQLNKTINHLVQILIIKDNVNINITKNSLHPLITNAIESVVYNINEVDYSVDLNLEVGEIWYNKAHLESILINLLSNAFKYRSATRPLIIEILTSEEPNGDVKMFVKDNGLGIDLKMHGEKMFGMYQRFHSNSNSTGLGLFIVKSQIEVLGGSIEVESEVDKGTTFVLTFRKKAISKRLQIAH